jgi:hypothetical protein
LRSSIATFDQAVSATFGDPIALQMIGTVRSYCIAEQWVSFGCGYCVAEQRVGFGCGYCIAEQAVCLSGSDCVAEQWIGFGGGEGIQCKNRESDTEDSLAFHDDVLRVAVVGYGADLTPHRGYENFIDLMVVIDAINSWSSMSCYWIDLYAVAYVTKRNALQSRKHKTDNLIFDSIIHTKKDPYQSKPKRVFPHSDDPYFKSSK